MCLERIDNSQIVDLPDVVIAYKVVSVDKDGVMSAPCFGDSYNNGLNKLPPDDGDWAESYPRSFHAFLKEEDAINWTMPPRDRVMPISVKKENIVAFGYQPMNSPFYIRPAIAFTEFEFMES
jgi:hypothetical protein